MPVKVERKLKSEARKKGFSGDRFNAYVYGTLAAMKKHAKGRTGGKKK